MHPTFLSTEAKKLVHHLAAAACYNRPPAMSLDRAGNLQRDALHLATFQGRQHLWMTGGFVCGIGYIYTSLSQAQVQLICA